MARGTSVEDEWRELVGGAVAAVMKLRLFTNTTGGGIDAPDARDGIDAAEAILRAIRDPPALKHAGLPKSAKEKRRIRRVADIMAGGNDGNRHGAAGRTLHETVRGYIESAIADAREREEVRRAQRDPAGASPEALRVAALASGLMSETTAADVLYDALNFHLPRKFGAEFGDWDREWLERAFAPVEPDKKPTSVQHFVRDLLINARAREGADLAPPFEWVREHERADVLEQIQKYVGPTTANDPRGRRTERNK